MLGKEVLITAEENNNNNNPLPSHGVKLVNRNNLSYRVGQLEKWMERHDHENCSQLEKLDDRVDKQTMRTERYYSVITPEEIKTVLESTHRNELELKGLTERFNDFQQDRVRRLEVANEKIDALKDDIVKSENRGIALNNKTNETVNRNKIKSQQYVITVVVSIIAAIIISGVIGYMRF
jgi:hypothetical protein